MLNEANLKYWYINFQNVFIMNNYTLNLQTSKLFLSKLSTLMLSDIWGETEDFQQVVGTPHHLQPQRKPA